VERNNFYGVNPNIGFRHGNTLHIRLGDLLEVIGESNGESNQVVLNLDDNKTLQQKQAIHEVGRFLSSLSCAPDWQAD